MLGDSRAFSGFSVDDITTAKNFYENTLGMKVAEDAMGFIRLQPTGGNDIIVYPKDDHAPASFTVLNFPVDDIDSTVEQLAERGVTFERYEGFEQDDKGIARDPQGPAIAWFKDPAGNILSVLQEP